MFDGDAVIACFTRLFIDDNKDGAADRVLFDYGIVQDGNLVTKISDGVFDEEVLAPPEFSASERKMEFYMPSPWE